MLLAGAKSLRPFYHNEKFNKMNKIIKFACVILFTTTSLLNAQDFYPFAFIDYTPKWSRYTMADSLSILTQGYIPEGKPIYKDGYLYLLHNIFDIAPNQGHITEKIDFKSGVLEWSNWNYFKQLNTREFASNLKFDGDNLSIIINKEINSNPFLGLSLWFSSYLGTRSYSDQSGINVDSYFTNTFDTLNKNVPVPISIFATVRKYLANEKGYKRISLSPNSMQLLNINVLGHHLDSVQFLLNNLPYSKGIWEGDISEDKIIFISHSKLSGDSKEDQQVKLYIIDHDLNIIHEKDITSFLPKNGEDYELIAYNDKFFHIKSYESVFNVFQPVTFTSFDIEGNLIESITIDNVLKTDIISVSLSSDGTMLIANSKDENEYSNIYIYKSDGNGNFELKKHLKPAKKDDLLLINKMYHTYDNDILLSFLHISRKLQTLPIVPKWRNWTLINGKDLGLTTSTYSYDVNRPKLYPNPVSDLLNIESEFIYNEIEIIKIDGTLYKKEKTSTKYIDISILPNGTYICILKDNGKSIGQQKFIKIN
jgi:hypothetical protein